VVVASVAGKTGLYLATITIPGGWVDTDYMYVRGEATVDTVSDIETLWTSEPQVVDVTSRAASKSDATLAQQTTILASVNVVELLTVDTLSTTTVVNITCATTILVAHLEDALIITNTGTVKGYTRIASVTGSTGDFELTVTPALPVAPAISDTFILGPKYLDSGSL